MGRSTPRYTTLADKFEGKRFNSPNDLAVHSSGAVYFTDPPYGLGSRGTNRPRNCRFRASIAFRPTGKLTLLTKDLIGAQWHRFFAG